MMWWNDDGSGWGWPWFLVVALAMLFCMAMMARMMRHGRTGGTQQGSAPNETSAERILAERLARGEIEVEEYRRLRDVLRRTSSPTADAKNPGRGQGHSPQP